MDDAAVARRMKLARLGRGLTQRELGERLGKSADAIKQLETGRGVGRETLEAFAKALDVSFSYLSLGITQATDIEIIVQGARQAGWDEAVERMRESLAEIQISKAAARGRKRRTMPPDALLVRERDAKQGKKGA